jgi:hypothetical protein
MSCALTLALLAIPSLLVGCGSDEGGGGKHGDGGDAGGAMLDVGKGERTNETDQAVADAAIVDAGEAMDTALAIDAVLPVIDARLSALDTGSSNLDLGRLVLDAVPVDTAVTADTGVDATTSKIDGASAGADANRADSGLGIMSCAAVVQGMQSCVEFSGALTADMAAQEQTGCVQGNPSSGTAAGAFATEACATTGASGICANISGIGGIPAGILVKYVYYALSSTQVASAQKVCTTSLGGSWMTTNQAQ